MTKAFAARPAAPADPACRSVRNAGDTRARILAAARMRFSRDAYENVGTRDIAADAGVDAALVNRYFGGKDKLFAEVLDGTFALKSHLSESLDTLGEHLVGMVMDEPGAPVDCHADALRLLLLAAGSPATVALVSARFHAEFVLPLARLLPGGDAEVRAGLIASYVIGLATLRHALGSSALQGAAARRKAIALAGAAIQACVAGS